MTLTLPGGAAWGLGYWCLSASQGLRFGFLFAGIVVNAAMVSGFIMADFFISEIARTGTWEPALRALAVQQSELVARWGFIDLGVAILTIGHGYWLGLRVAPRGG